MSGYAWSGLTYTLSYQPFCVVRGPDRICVVRGPDVGLCPPTTPSEMVRFALRAHPCPGLLSISQQSPSTPPRQSFFIHPSPIPSLANLSPPPTLQQLPTAWVAALHSHRCKLGGCSSVWSESKQHTRAYLWCRLVRPAVTAHSWISHHWILCSC